MFYKTIPFLILIAIFLSTLISVPHDAMSAEETAQVDSDSSHEEIIIGDTDSDGETTEFEEEEDLSGE